MARLTFYDAPAHPDELASAEEENNNVTVGQRNGYSLAVHTFDTHAK